MLNLETIGNTLHRQSWTFAKSYPWVPHYWVTAKQWEGSPNIVQACHFISTQGTRMLWGKSNPAVRSYIDWEGWRYWHMDFDEFFRRFDGSKTLPNQVEKKEWDCICYLINRQRLHISKAKFITRDLKMPKRYEDFTLSMTSPPKANMDESNQEQMSLL